MGTSYQRGWVSLRGKKWYGYFRRTVLDPETNQPKMVSAPIALGLKSEMTKSQAREKLAQEIRRLSGQISEDGSVKNGTVTFGWFVRNRYLPLKESDWREETAKVKKLIITADLIVPFEDVRLENFDKYTLQSHLNQLAKTHSKDRVLQIRSYVRAIFAEVVDQDYLAKDPARSLRVPANLREVDRTTLTWEQLRAALDRLLEKSRRDWTLMTLDMANALRPSELFCLRWRSFLEAALLLDIQETLYKGKIRPYGKTKGSTTQVPIAEALAEKVVEWREELRMKGKDVSPDAFMFGGRFGGPMDPSNFRKRVLHKLAEELELPKLTFQVIRRTIATLAQGHVKGIQGMMRHSQVSTTTNVYMQILQPEVRSTVNSIHRELSRKTVRKTSPKPSIAAVRNFDGPRMGEALAASSAVSINTANDAEVPAMPSRGVVLEFATKMRQSRGREVLRNA